VLEESLIRRVTCVGRTVRRAKAHRKGRKKSTKDLAHCNESAVGARNGLLVKLHTPNPAPEVSEWRGLGLADGLPISFTLPKLVGIEPCRVECGHHRREGQCGEVVAADPGSAMTRG
jgi:hypothetical protein